MTKVSSLKTSSLATTLIDEYFTHLVKHEVKIKLICA